MINLNTLNDSEYRSLRLQIIAQVEESGDLRQKVYLDSKGIPSIGVGMNLRSNEARDAVLDAILGDISESGDIVVEDSYRTLIQQIALRSYPKTSVGVAQLQSDLDKVMSDRAADSRITFANKRTSFSFLNDQEITNTFSALADSVYEERVNNWYGSVIPDSQERAILFSLSYNGILAESSKLKEAFQSGNRAAAWYQIRYQSNGDHLNGIAKRRYYESALFGLYDNPNSVSESEAKTLFQVFTDAEVRDKVAKYDARYSAQIAHANQDYSTDVVKTFKDSTASARDLLVSLYAAGASIDQVLVGSSGVDVLPETISATSGVKTNSLIFGEGAVDTYSFPKLTTSSGDDVIVASSNDGKVVVGGIKLGGSTQPKEGSVSGSEIWTTDQGFDLHRSGNNLIITKAGAAANSGSITVKNFPFTNARGAFTFFSENRKDVAATPLFN